MLKQLLYLVAFSTAYFSVISSMKENIVGQTSSAKRPLEVSLFPTKKIIPKNVLSNKVEFSLESNQIMRAELRTSVQRFYTSLSSNIVNKLSNDNKVREPKIEVDLYSTVHVGSNDYYKSLEESLSNYNIVLYELITNKENIIYEMPFRRRLRKSVYSPQAEDIAKKLNLTTQLTLLQEQSNWFIADLDKEAVASLERNNKGKLFFAYWNSIIGGRAFEQDFLNNFYISDKSFLSALRLLAWLTPCPELNCLLIDWARMSPKAGGISPLIIPILENFLRRDFDAVKRLIFAQQLLGGLPDAGSWGGEAKSDIAVRVLARNQECCRVLEEFVSEFRQEFAEGKNYKDIKIAILYGAFHITELSRRLTSSPILNLKLNESFIPSKNFTAWSVDCQLSNIDNDSYDDLQHLTDLSLPPRKSLIIAAIISLAYLLLGALDWWVIIKIIAQDYEISSIVPQLNSNSAEISLTWTFVYILLYIQRHLFLLSNISSVGVQWDRGLFTNI